MAYTEEQAKRDFLEQDKAWNAPRFFVLGIVSLAISIGLIFWMSHTAGCSVVWVP
jgi:hypothetical protein